MNLAVIQLKGLRGGANEASKKDISIEELAIMTEIASLTGGIVSSRNGTISRIAPSPDP